MAIEQAGVAPSAQPDNWLVGTVASRVDSQHAWVAGAFRASDQKGSNRCPAVLSIKTHESTSVAKGYGACTQVGSAVLVNAGADR